MVVKNRFSGSLKLKSRNKTVKKGSRANFHSGKVVQRSRSTGRPSHKKSYKRGK